MARQGNFKAATTRERLKHAQGKCEGNGPLYGFDPGRRCNADLAYGVEYDHWDIVVNSKDNSFDNCRAVCPACHRFKTSKHDVPRAAKTQRQQDKNNGIRRPKGKLKSAPFPKPEKERKGRDTLPPRKLYQ
jgi:hypothetical protein